MELFQGMGNKEELAQMKKKELTRWCRSRWREVFQEKKQPPLTRRLSKGNLDLR
jgi:hypothetical protein